jgi:ABC-type multidrug transport system fused ATPase/permease subunit
MLEKTSKNDFFRTISLLGSKTWTYFLAALVSSIVIAYGFNMVLAFIQRNVMDAAYSGQGDLLVQALILAGITFFVGTPLWMITQYTVASISKKTMTRTRISMFEQLVKLPVDRFDKQHSGDLVSRSTNDLNVIERIFQDLIPGLLFGFILGVVGVILIMIMDWRLGLLALVIGMLIVLASTTMAGPLRERSEAIQQSMGAVTERLTDLLQGLQVTKMFHLEETTHQLFAQKNGEWAEATVRQASLQAKFDALNVFFEWMRSLGTLAFGLYFFVNGFGTLGTIVAAIHLQGNAGFLFSNLGNFITHIQTSLAGAERVFEVMRYPIEPGAQPAAAAGRLDPAPADKTVIQFHNLSFRYDQDESENLFDRINLHASRGQLIALVGPSGGGKSTLVKLLLGIYTKTGGEIYLNGRALGSYPLTQLRDMIAYVPQDAYLFDGTIEENIRYGNMNATFDQVVSAAKAAYAHDFIIQGKDGYQTQVGERGTHLSGGQRQRIAIARALLKNAPILLLDEATSALDSESEQLVQQALETLIQGRTTVAVAHRLSTIRHADRIYVIEKGGVAEQGTHDELVDQDGLYKRLYSMQFGAGNQLTN